VKHSKPHSIWRRAGNVNVTNAPCLAIQAPLLRFSESGAEAARDRRESISRADPKIYTSQSEKIDAVAIGYKNVALPGSFLSEASTQ